MAISVRLLLAALAACCGCAGVTHVVVPVEPQYLDDPHGGAANAAVQATNAAIAQRNRAAEAATDGIRYYRASLYLLVYSDGKGGIKWEVISMPDPFRKLAAEPFDKLATLAFKMDFSNSAVAMTETADSTALPNAVINAVKEALPAFFTAAANEAKSAEEGGRLPAPQLYKIVQGADGRTRFVGGPGPKDENKNEDIHVTVLPTTPAAK